MARNIFMKAVKPQGQWVRVTDQPTVVTATFVPNGSYLQMRINGGTPAEWGYPAAVTIEGIDLSEVEIYGEDYDFMLIVGHTR